MKQFVNWNDLRALRTLKKDYDINLDPKDFDEVRLAHLEMLKRVASPKESSTQNTS